MSYDLSFNSPIVRKDIKDYYDLEAEATAKRWEATMKLSLKERIRKRTAIFEPLTASLFQNPINLGILIFLTNIIFQFLKRKGM